MEIPNLYVPRPGVGNVYLQLIFLLVDMCVCVCGRYGAVLGAGVLQPGGDPRAVRHHGAARLAARGAARVQVQLPAARARRARAAPPQRRHRRGGGLQSPHGHALRALHDLLAAADGESFMNLFQFPICGNHSFDDFGSREFATR